MILAAEFKRASPSKGAIALHVDLIGKNKKGIHKLFLS